MRTQPVIQSFALITTLLSSGSALSGGPPATREAHCRIYAGTTEANIPKTIDWLMDNQYVVRSVNQAAGIISFDKVAKWNGSQGNRHLVKIEGCILLRSNKGRSSMARVTLNQEWFEAGSSGIAEMGVETDLDETYYKDLFAGLEQKLGGVGN